MLAIPSHVIVAMVLANGCLQVQNRDSCCADHGRFQEVSCKDCTCLLSLQVVHDSGYGKMITAGVGYTNLIGLGMIRCEYIPVECLGDPLCCEFGEQVLHGVCGNWGTPAHNHNCSKGAG